MSFYETTHNDCDVTVEYSFSKGYPATFDDPGCDDEIEILSVMWSIEKDIQLPITSKNLPPVTLKKLPLEIDVLPLLSHADIETLITEILEQPRYDY